MDKRIREVYSDAVLTEALARYGVTTDSAHLLDGFESFIYEYEKDGQGYVLRITHSSRRTADLIGGEVDWINMKLREIDLYIAIHRSFDLDDLDPWCASFMRDRKYKIEHDVPYVDMSFG